MFRTRHLQLIPKPTKSQDRNGPVVYGVNMSTGIGVRLQNQSLGMLKTSWESKGCWNTQVGVRVPRVIYLSPLPWLSR